MPYPPSEEEITFFANAPFSDMRQELLSWQELARHTANFACEECSVEMSTFSVVCQRLGHIELVSSDRSRLIRDE